MYYEKHIKIVQVKFFKTSPGKFQFMILGDKTCYKHLLKIKLTCVQSSDDVTLLGVMIDKNLTFKKHIDNLVRKNFILCGALESFSLQKKLKYWVMLLRQLIQLCTYNMDVLQENILF